MSVEQKVAAHYSQSNLAVRILDAATRIAVEKGATEPVRITARDLAPFDEFHLGGLEATERFLPMLGIARGSHWLDVGSGIGGASRYAVERFRCRVTGIDLTPDFCATADTLTEKVGLTNHLTFIQGSALDMPFGDAEFDGAFTLHVAMNIADKTALYREVHRVLKKRATFGIYDILAGPNVASLQFPLPWATSPDASFLATIDGMRAMLDDAGFDIVSSEDRRSFAQGYFGRQRQLAASGAAQPGLGLIIGDEFKQKIGNVVGGLDNLCCWPWEIVCRKR